MNLSASGLARAEACPASTHLPQAPRSHADAAAGQDAHAVLEASPEAGERREVVFALNVETGEAVEIERKAPREYPARGPEWIFGTTDSVRVEPARVVISDDKTGFGFNVSPAKSNLQLGFYALAAARIAGVNAARVEIRFHDGRPVDGADLDAIDLDAIGARLARIVKAAQASAAGEPVVRPGEVQCWRCPCFARCPAQTGLALTLASGVPLRELPTVELTVPAVAAGWAKLKAIKKVLNEIERAYRGFAAEQDVPLADGGVLGRVEKSRKSIDARVALKALRELHGDEIADAAVEYETSEAAIERALKTIAKRGKLAGMVRTAIEAIQQNDGITRKTTLSVEEH